MNPWFWLVGLWCLAAAGCTERVLVDTDVTFDDESSDLASTSEDPETSSSSVGGTSGVPTRPFEVGAFYSACEAGNECGGLDYCVSPQNEPGFCTEPCDPRAGASDCPNIPGAERLTRCIDLHATSAFCAISCEDHDCPSGMRCEVVAGASGGVRVCF